jgi:hypothetical protein
MRSLFKYAVGAGLLMDACCQRRRSAAKRNIVRQKALRQQKLKERKPSSKR